MSLRNSRLACEDAVHLLRNGDMLHLGEMAHAARMQECHPHIITYVVDRNINYSNICIAHCNFCAFAYGLKDPRGYVLPDEVLFQKIAELVKIGGTQVLLQGGLHPTLPFSYYTSLLTKIKERFSVDLHAFSSPEIIHFTHITRRSIPEVLQELRKAGLDSIPGGGGEILSDRVRKTLSSNKCTREEWLAVHEAAHKMGIRTTATMMFGHIETLEERIEHLQYIRQLQDQTGGFTAFIPWTFQGGNTRMDEVPESGAVDYLKTLAVSRLFLDNIPNIQASFITQGKQVGQMALFFGANDMGGTMMEENVVAATGVHNCSHEPEVRRLITDAGFTPQKRNTQYQYLN